MALLVGRAVTVLAVGGTALALLAPPAAAVVTATTDGIDTITIESDATADTLDVTCDGGQATVNGMVALPGMDCTDVRTVRVDAPDGTRTVDLGDVLADFPALDHTTVDVADDDDDAVVGSPGRDIVGADVGDTVDGGAGDDVLTGGDTVSGGEGDDVLRDVSGDVHGGAGDDRVIGFPGGVIDGGAGYDVVVQDYTASTLQPAVTLVVSDSSVGPFAGLGNASGIEQYDVTTSTAERADSISATGYSGSLVVSTQAGNDNVRGGSGSDVVDGGAGNDVLDPGPGADVVRGGSGSDTISVRDGVADAVDCGDGVDTVTADRSDVLVGCETVSLPPPETSVIVGRKRVVKNAKALFAFAASVATATFECRIDARPFKVCTSPLTVKSRKLEVGRHTLSVRAVQPAGNPDPTPSTLRFKVRPRKR